MALFWLTVIQRDGTFFKKALAQSRDLPPCQKYFVSETSNFVVEAYRYVTNNHYLVTFSGGFSGGFGCPIYNTWYVYRPHVTIQQLTQEEMENRRLG
jgi:hypothetical protein